MNSEVCVLDDGRRVRFSLKKRNRDPCYLVSFRGPDGKRKERSTKEKNKKRATDSAVVVIKDEYAPKVALKRMFQSVISVTSASNKSCGIFALHCSH